MTADLERIDLTSGVSAFTGEPYVHVAAIVDGEVAGFGQLSPAEMRAHGLAALEAAEAAESDALVFAELTETAGLEAPSAAAFLVALRARREASSS